MEEFAKTDKHQQQSGKSKHRVRSSSSSSDEITIKINLKKGEAKTKKKHRTINICAHEDSEEDQGVQKETRKNPETKDIKNNKDGTNPKPIPPVAINELITTSTAGKTPSQAPELKPDRPTEPPKPAVSHANPQPPGPVPPQDAQPTPQAPAEPRSSTAGAQPAQTLAPADSQAVDRQESAANALSSLGLGIKVVETSKTYTVKPQPAKTAATLDNALLDLATTLLSKLATPEVRAAAVERYLQQAAGKVFVKIALTDLGREQKLELLDSILQAFQASALKLYVLENQDKPCVVGGLHWDLKDNFTKLNPDFFKLTVLSLDNPEEEKEISKTLKSCLKAK